MKLCGNKIDTHTRYCISVTAVQMLTIKVFFRCFYLLTKDYPVNVTFKVDFLTKSRYKRNDHFRPSRVTGSVIKIQHNFL